MELHLKIIGCVLIALALIHIGFPRYFNWRGEFQSVALINKQMMYVHTFFIALTVFLMGALCLFCSADICHTPLGKQLALGLFLFWFVRLVFQVFIYSPKLWKGKLFETAMHILFTSLWIYLCIIFFIVLRND